MVIRSDFSQLSFFTEIVRYRERGRAREDTGKITLSCEKERSTETQARGQRARCLGSAECGAISLDA